MAINYPVIINSVDGQPITTPQQFVLSLFEEVGLTTKSIIDAKNSDVMYSKSSLLIDTSSLTLKARQSLNALHFIASETPGQQDEYSMDLGLFKWMTALHNTRNYEFIRDTLKECQSATIDLDNGQDCAAIPLLGRFVISNGQIRFALDSVLKMELDKTDVRYFINMRIQTAFGSIYSLQIYEQFCKVQLPGSTPWYEVNEFRSLIGANGKTHDNFKVLNAKIIKPSIVEIECITGFNVVMEVDRREGSRSITHIRFVLKSDGKISSLGNRHAQELKRLYETLRDEFGMSDKDLDSILVVLETRGESYIEEAIDYCRDYIMQKAKNDEPVRSPARLLLKGLEEGWRLPISKRPDRVKKNEIKSGLDEGKSNSIELVNKRSATASSLRKLIKDCPEQATSEWIVFSKKPHAKLLLKRWKLLQNDMHSACENDFIAELFYSHLEPLK